MERMMRVVIVDDEELGRDVLRTRLEAAPDIEILGEAGDGRSAVELIVRQRPDLVFLDVQMPDLDGVEVLEEVSRTYLPLVVFVTAWDRYAIRAFELHALDYLLKPVSPRRLIAALERARLQLARQDIADRHEQVARLLDGQEAEGPDGGGPAPRTGPGPARRIVVRDDDDYLLVRVDEVDALEAAGNYVRIVTDGGTHLLRSTLEGLADELDAGTFVRIHRSTVVNADRVERITPLDYGDCTVTLASGRQYRMSRTYRGALLP